MQGCGKYCSIVGTWHSHLPFHAKVFIWRVMIGELPLGSALNKWWLGSTCFFCTILLENNTHRFIKRLVAHSIWTYLSKIWQVLSRCYLMPQQWVFAQHVQNVPNDELEIIFRFLWYWGLQHIWNMWNSFLFNGRHGAKPMLRVWKTFSWNFWMLDHVGLFFKCIFKFFNGFIGCPPTYIGRED